MNETLIYAVISLSATGSLAAIILYFVAQKFKVIEDPRIDEIEEVLPSANCGACGYPGCRNFAEAVTKVKNLENYFCPVGGNDCMANIAKILGLEAAQMEAMIAVVRCSGSHEHRPKTSSYDSASSCKISSAVVEFDRSITGSMRTFISEFGNV